MDAKSFYNNFAVAYPLADYFLKGHKKLLANKVNHYSNGGNLLEIGVGRGSHLNAYNNVEVTGIDVSSAMLNRARLKNKSIAFFEMDAENLHFQNNRFDIVVMSHVIAVVKHPEAVVSEAYRVLKPGGYLFILNHFTPTSYIRWFDYIVQPLAKLLYLKSVFKTEMLQLHQFKVKEEIAVGKLNYFKLIILKK